MKKKRWKGSGPPPPTLFYLVTALEILSKVGFDFRYGPSLLWCNFTSGPTSPVTSRAMLLVRRCGTRKHTGYQVLPALDSLKYGAFWPPTKL